MNPFDEVKCVRCGRTDIVRNMYQSRPASPMLGTPAEWICDNCYRITDSKLTSHDKRKAKHWSQRGSQMKREREKL